ncbi:MAG: molybdenum cofactor biosynthesis protein MoaE [Proteobacteria bacterium]|nr:molybdenum cofactor biosynthesis protein MoaE [Pseudomonadota bacterium]
MIVKVQAEDFDAAAEIRTLIGGRTDVGAVVTFTGLMRGGEGATLTLEHYAGMSEKELTTIAEEAAHRWPLTDLLIIHRHGTLNPGDQIVLVATLAAHRGDAFAAAEFLMDWLKTRAPFWKKEEAGGKTPGEAKWVEARADDEKAAERWEEKE